MAKLAAAGPVIFDVVICVTTVPAALIFASQGNLAWALANAAAFAACGYDLTLTAARRGFWWLR